MSLFVLLILSCIGVDGFAPPTFIATPTPPLSSLINHPVVWNNAAVTTLFVGRGLDPDHGIQRIQEEEDSSFPPSSLLAAPSTLWATLTRGGPPLDVDDPQLLLYDVFLLMTLATSISFLVVHRLDFQYVASGLHEGALLSVCWIVAGLGNGAFLRSAVDGHYDPARDLAEYAAKGGPRAAGLLALSTFVTTMSLRVATALALAVPGGRPVGTGGEELIPLEILFGLVMMSAWRFWHSVYTPRM